MKILQPARTLYHHLKRETLGVLAAEPLGSVRMSVLQALGKPPLMMGSFEEGASASYQVAGSSTSTTATPAPIGSRPILQSRNFGPVQAHLFLHALASPYVTGIIHEGILRLPSHLIHERDRISTAGGALFDYGDNYVVARRKSSLEIPEGILIGGAGAFNWYHFLVECMPKAFLASRLPQEFSSFPLLVPEECKNISSFSDSLNVFSGKREVIFISPRQVALVKKLVVFDEVSIGPFNMTRGAWMVASDYMQHDELMRDYIKELRINILKESAPREPIKRYFLTRPGLRRKYNQEELLEVSARFGFVPLALETLSLTEQAKCLSEAQALVGPSGAAWTGLAFNASGLQGLSWLPAEYAQFSSYSSLAHLLGHGLSFLTIENQRPLRSSADAYKQSYKIDPLKFSHALEELYLGQ